MTADNHYKIMPRELIPSGFVHDTTAVEALGGRDLSGKTTIVTDVLRQINRFFRNP